MILVDTSIWIDHFRDKEPRLSACLVRREVLIHAFVLGELALGDRRLAGTLPDLSDLPHASLAAPAEVMRLIAQAALAGSGIGYVDAHLVASTLLTPNARLWTRDRKLHAVAERLAIAAKVD